MNKIELTKIIKESLINYFYESLNTQKQKYGDNLVNKLLLLDPTKTYKYIEQICSYYKEGISEKEIKKYIDLYNTKLTKNLISKEYSNINKIKTFKDLKDIVDNKSQKVSHSGFEDNLMKEIYLTTITTNKGTFKVYRPYNMLQQIKLGKNTKWCISSIEYKNEFNNYFINNNIRFYLFIKDNDTKFQLNIYPNNRKEVWNTLNKEIGCDEFKELTNIDCKDYSWYPANEYVKDIVIYDQYGHKIGHMINNKLNGEHFEYYDNGNIYIKTNYKDDELDGEYFEYYDNGNIKFKQYYKNGKLNGEKIEYYKNGNIYIKTNYKDDELDGEYFEYYDNGNIKLKAYYENGIRTNDAILYYRNGNINIKEYYKDDKLDGEYIEYYENGNINVKEHYKNNKLEGERIWCYTNGNVKVKVYYKNDKKDGEYIEYDKNGNIISKSYYKDGVKVNDNE